MNILIAEFYHDIKLKTRNANLNAEYSVITATQKYSSRTQGAHALMDPLLCILFAHV
jgi:hypothetical protein